MKKESLLKISLIFFVFVIILLAISMLTNSTVTENDGIEVHITVKDFGFSKEPLPFDENMYGYISGNVTEDHEETYYLNKEQMAGLSYASNETFEYPDGLDIACHYYKDEDGLRHIAVDHIYLPDGTEIEPLSGEECDRFVDRCEDISAKSEIFSVLD